MQHVTRLGSQGNVGANVVGVDGAALGAVEIVGTLVGMLDVGSTLGELVVGTREGADVVGV